MMPGISSASPSHAPRSMTRTLPEPGPRSGITFEADPAAT